MSTANNEDTLEAVPGGWCLNGKQFYPSGATIPVPEGVAINLDAAPSLLRPEFFLDGNPSPSTIEPKEGPHSLLCQFTRLPCQSIGDITGTLNVGMGTEDASEALMPLERNPDTRHTGERRGDTHVNA
ncbi:hypothetical protein LXT21_26015 [Myxococcus sp. K38C18041901]|uniref:hypothetical protein n=1 Tax=Myxococcus guangdongensis TaxID=2906760 RepID=UPI0020A7466B|nr:hypothetical protein [Myxococcus guangdongensis]MCP3062250.1 hypothetical protein [Myxococcus guangdongensis]